MDIQQSEAYERLIGAAIRFVSFRPRSEKELRRYCNKYEPDVIERVIERMRELGYVDDEKFTLWWIDQRGTFNPKGKRMLEAELRAKGIQNPTIHIDEQELAQKAIERKIGVWDKKKLYNFLCRRGFDPSVVDDVLQKE